MPQDADNSYLVKVVIAGRNLRYFEHTPTSRDAYITLNPGKEIRAKFRVTASGERVDPPVQIRVRHFDTTSLSSGPIVKEFTLQPLSFKDDGPDSDPEKEKGEAPAQPRR